MGIAVAQLFRTAGQSVVTDIDLDANGRQVGHARLPHSSHRSAYGWLPIPLASIRNGDGPVALVIGGNHGDEYEGQIIASRLAREIAPEMVRGQLIVLPMANFPAAQAGTRTSPIDGGNLNRLFPGDPAGGVTPAIARYIEQVLLARADLVIDLHSGGSSLLYHGTVALAGEPVGDTEQRQLPGLLDAFGAHYTSLLKTLNPATMLGAARRQGALCIVGELGGAGTVSRAGLDRAWHGVCRTLQAFGVLGPGCIATPPALPGTRIELAFGSDTHHVYARAAGVFEPLVALGDEVQAGQGAALIHDPATPGQAPQRMVFEGPGIVVCQRVPAQAVVGDCLFQIGSPVPPHRSTAA